MSRFLIVDINDYYPVFVHPKVNIPLPQYSLFANIVFIDLIIRCIITIIRVIMAES